MSPVLAACRKTSPAFRCKINRNVWAKAARGCSSFEPLQQRIDFVQIVPSRVEFPTNPFLHVFVFGMLRIGHDFKEVVIAAHAAAILGRTSGFMKLAFERAAGRRRCCNLRYVSSNRIGYSFVEGVSLLDAFLRL